MLYGEIITVCSVSRTKRITTLRGQNDEIWIVKPRHGAEVFKKSTSHLKILRARSMTRNKLHTEDPPHKILNPGRHGDRKYVRHWICWYMWYKQTLKGPMYDIAIYCVFWIILQNDIYK